MLSNYNHRTDIDSKNANNWVLFLLYLIQLLMNFFKILENNKINISQQFFQKNGFADFFHIFIINA